MERVRDPPSALHLFLYGSLMFIVMIFSYARNVLQLEDPDSVWIDLCKGTPAAEHMCKAFLEDYIDSSTKFLPVVGSDEAKEVQTVKSVRTVIALWERLVVEADARVLCRKRREARGQDDVWFLKADKRRNTGPVAQIIQVGLLYYRRTNSLHHGLSNTRDSG